MHALLTAPPMDVADAVSRAQGRSFGQTCATRSFFCDGERWIQDALVPIARAALSSSAGCAEVDGDLDCAKAGAEADCGEEADCGPQLHFLSRMRFLCYRQVGGNMQAHVDLRKTDPGSFFGSSDSNGPSTHTFMLHLADCASGGETVLLNTLSPTPEGHDDMAPLAACQSSLPTTTTMATAAAAAAAAASNTVLAAVAPVRGRLLLFPHVCPHAGRPVVDVPKLFLRGELRCF
jgi:hypothetical protein